MTVLILAGALVLAQAEAAFAKFEEAVNKGPALQLTFSHSGVFQTGGAVSAKLEVKGTLALATGNRMHLKVVQTTDWCEKDRKESVSEFTFISDGKLLREILRRDGQDTVTDMKTPVLLRANLLTALTRTGIGLSQVQMLRQGFKSKGNPIDELDFRSLYHVSDLALREAEDGVRTLTYRLGDETNYKLWYDPVGGKPLRRTISYKSGLDNNSFTDLYADVKLAADIPDGLFSIENKK